MPGDFGTIYLKLLKVQMTQLPLPLSHSCLVEGGSFSCKMPQLLICLNGKPASLIRESLSLKLLFNSGMGFHLMLRVKTL